jgi:hypothetical protein
MVSGMTSLAQRNCSGTYSHGMAVLAEEVVFVCQQSPNLSHQRQTNDPQRNAAAERLGDNPAANASPIGEPPFLLQAPCAFPLRHLLV